MAPFPHVSLRIDLGPGRRLGPGKARLLHLIDQHGSISAAAREMGMSYRRAWLLAEESNQLFASPLVESATGGEGGGGTRLTPLGREVLAAYEAIVADTRSLIDMRLAALPQRDGRPD